MKEIQGKKVKLKFKLQKRTMKNNRNQLPACLFMLVICFISVSRLSAQDSTALNKWHFLLEPYAMFPNMHGTAGLGNLPDAEVDEDPGDIFKNLQVGAMLYAEAYKGPWAI